MIKDQLDLFADRQEAIYLFEQLCDRQPGKSWPLLPVLTLVGPAGSGKSLFIRHLYFRYGQSPSFLPHAILDFDRRDAPRDLLNIFGTLRNSLRRQRDERGHALTFPRFDIIYARLKRSEDQEDKDEIEELFGDFSDLIGLVGNAHIGLGLLLFIVKIIARFLPLHILLRWFIEQAYERAGGRAQWRWYQDQVKKFPELNLPDDAPIGKILTRLNEMCTMGDPEREFLIEQILPKAFLADLRYGPYDNESPMLRVGPRCVVLFLDSFEVLLRSAETTARQLMEALALNEYRKRGASDPLLLIVGSEERLPDMSRDQINQHFPLATKMKRNTVQGQARILHEDWMQQLPLEDDRHALRLRNMYLPLPLSSFSLEATRDYLLRLDRLNETHAFTSEALIEDIYRATQGYPSFLERVATALQSSGQNAGSRFKNCDELFATEQGEQIVDRQLALHCKQVEEQAFMLSAVPRILTPELLQPLLHLSEPELNSEWRRYRRLPFLLASEDKSQITFVPGLRSLFLRKLQISSSESDYLYAHQQLYNYFDQRLKREKQQAGTRNEQDLLELCYHALALGNYGQVIQYALDAQVHDLKLWKQILQVVEEAPTQKIPRAEIERLASEALYQLQQNPPSIELAVRAIVFYTWLLANPGSERKYVSSLWYNLGTVYKSLQKLDSRVRADTAAIYYQRVDELLDPPVEITRPLQLPKQKPSSGLLWSPPTLVQRLLQVLRSFYRFVRANRKLQTALGLLIVGALLVTLLAPRLFAQPVIVHHPTDSPFAIPLSQLQPGARSHWLGITVDSDNEFVGLSNGSIPFDYQRPDGAQKIQAARQFRQGNLSAARATLQSAVQSDVNDAEALIYLQNIQALLSAKSCTVFVVVSRIIEESSEGVNIGRDNLQGAYVAQKEYNEAHVEAPLCLYIANIGNAPGHELTVIQQVLKASASSQGMIQGVIGWPGLLDSPASLASVHLLEQAHLPIVSPDSYDEVHYISNVFHVAPSSQDQGRQAALYAEQVLHAKSAALITDTADPSSNALTEGFMQRFQENGNHLVSFQTYTIGHTGVRQLSAILQEALSTHPDLLYFTGGTDDGAVLLAQLLALNSSVPLLGSDKLYPFLGFSANARPGFEQLVFSSAAYPDAPASQHMKALYALDFDPQDPQGVREYGYSRPDAEAILSYDALETLITAYSDAVGLQSMQEALTSVHVLGASREHIIFTTLHMPIDQQEYILYVKQGQIHSVLI